MSARRPTQRALPPLRNVPTTPVPRNAFVHFQSEQAQGGSHDAGGAALLEGKFRMCVQIAPQRYEFREQVVDGQPQVSQRPASTASANSASVRKW